jgi:hypothetical protein
MRRRMTQCARIRMTQRVSETDIRRHARCDPVGALGRRQASTTAQKLEAPISPPAAAAMTQASRPAIVTRSQQRNSIVHVEVRI